MRIRRRDDKLPQGKYFSALCVYVCVCVCVYKNYANDRACLEIGHAYGTIITFSKINECTIILNVKYSFV